MIAEVSWNGGFPIAGEGWTFLMPDGGDWAIAGDFTGWEPEPMDCQAGAALPEKAKCVPVCCVIDETTGSVFCAPLSVTWNQAPVAQLFICFDREKI